MQDIEEIPALIREVYRTAWEIPQRALLDLAIARGPYIDQSQSTTVYMRAPSMDQLVSTVIRDGQSCFTDDWPLVVRRRIARHAFLWLAGRSKDGYVLSADDAVDVSDPATRSHRSRRHTVGSIR